MTQGYLEDYIRKYIEAEQNKRNSPYQNLKNTVGNISKTGNNMTTVGDFMKNNLNNPTLQNLGSNISGIGSKLSNGANAVNNVITPQNYFKGFAPRPFSALAPAGTATVGSSLGGSAIGNAIGSEVAGTAAGIGAVGSAIAEAAPMATAGSIGAGTAAGGAAAGGSAATGAAMSNPVTALAALAAMAAMGANRKRAKKSGEALMNSTNEMVNNGSEEALNQTNQFAKDSIGQDYTQNILPTNYDGTTGAAAQLSPIEEYQNALRAQGYSDDVINGVPQGLNGGYKEIDDWIKQYNNGTGRNNPINIPQTEEEIAAAKAGNFNVPTQTGSAESTEQVKRGLLDKFLSGISDLSAGYQENRNNGFKPENLQRDDSKSKMNRIGEAFGTIGRVAQNPLVQGLVAGGLSAALTGNPLYGLGQGYKFANNRAMSDARREALKQYGINLPEIGTFGNYSDKDVNALTTPYYKEAMNNIALAKLQEAQNYHNQMIENQKQLNNIRQQTADIKQQNANTQEYKAKNGTKVTHVGSGKKSSGGSAKTTYQLVNGKDGNVYRLNRATGEYQVVGSKQSGVPVTGNKDIVTANSVETEDEFKNRVFGNKKSNSNQGWAF